MNTNASEPSSQRSAFDRLFGALHVLRTTDEDRVVIEQSDAIRHVANALDEEGNRRLAPQREWDDIRTGASALTTAIPLLPAVKILEGAVTLSKPGSPARSILRRLAIQQLLRALEASYPLEPIPLPPSHAASSIQDSKPKNSPSPDILSNRAVLDNIARYHREHERYYSAYLLEQGAVLVREANKLKILANHWEQGDAMQPHYPGTDFTDPAYRIAGCDDLNPLPSLALSGILFMEGQGEPTEIRVLKAMLGSRSAGSLFAGKWLAEAMVAAWTRESALLAGSNIDAAEPRFRTIVTNWTGAQETQLAGRLLGLAAEILSSLDFSPEAIRRDRISHGKRLETAARILTLTAGIQGKSGVDLSTNDECWTQYRAHLKRTAA